MTHVWYMLAGALLTNNGALHEDVFRRLEPQDAPEELQPLFGAILRKDRDRVQNLLGGLLEDKVGPEETGMQALVRVLHQQAKDAALSRFRSKLRNLAAGHHSHRNWKHLMQIVQEELERTTSKLEVE